MKFMHTVATLTFVVLASAANALSQDEPPHPDPMPPKAPVQYIEPQYKKGSVEAELVRLDRAWTSAELKGDKKSVTAMLAEDFVGTTQLGEMQNKQQYIDGVTANSDMVHSDDYKITLYGGASPNIAVMTHRSTVQGVRNIQYRSTHVWMKRGKTWQIVAHHGSMVSDPEE